MLAPQDPQIRRPCRHHERKEPVGVPDKDPTQGWLINKNWVGKGGLASTSCSDGAVSCELQAFCVCLQRLQNISKAHETLQKSNICVFAVYRIHQDLPHICVYLYHGTSGLIHGPKSLVPILEPAIVQLVKNGCEGFQFMA